MSTSPKSTLSNAGKSIRHALPKLLTFVGVGCTLKSVISSSKAALNAQEKINNSKKELTVKEKLKLVIPCYIETSIYTLLACAAPIAADNMYSKRIAAATALAEMATTAYQQKDILLKKVLGEKKAEVEESKAKEEKAKEEKPYRKEEIEISKFGGDQLFEDIWGRRFRSSICAVNDGINRANASINDYDEVTQDDLYYNWGIHETHEGVGANLIWSANTTGLIEPDKFIWYEYNGEPCAYINITMPTTRERY